jgi:anti-anti-sigma factor
MKRLRIRSRIVRKQLRVITVSGDLDLEGSEKLRGRLFTFLNRKPMHVALDLSNVTLLSSSAASLLYQYKEEAAKHGVKLALLAPSEAVTMVIELLGGDRVFMIQESLEDVLEAMRIR